MEEFYLYCRKLVWVWKSLIVGILSIFKTQQRIWVTFFISRNDTQIFAHFGTVIRNDVGPWPIGRILLLCQEL